MGERYGYSLPAPVGGINLSDPLDQMPPEDAISLWNLFGDQGRVSVRGGTSTFCDTSSASSIRALYKLPLKDGTTKLIACANSKFYKVDTGTSSDVTGATAPTSNDWNGAVFGHNLFLCNGVDTVQQWAGAGNFADATFTGVTLSTLINVSSYKEKIYFIKKNTGSFWYRDAVKALSGALSEYDVSYFLRLGGYLLFAGSWTNQLSSTSADLFFICSSEGEILFFSGGGPSSGDWGLVARFVIGKPLGYRAFIRVDNDLWILTEQGVVPITSLFSGSPTAAADSLGRKVSVFFTENYASVGFSHLWHGVHWPQGRRVYIVVPTSATQTILLVYNTNTGKWFPYRFTTEGRATSITTFAGYPHLGTKTGLVVEFEDASSDNGDPIEYEFTGAFNFFGSRANVKKFLDLRPIMKTQRGITIGVGIDTDFKQLPFTDTITTSTGLTTSWGSVWGSPWSTEIEYVFDRFSIKGQGHSGAIKVRGSIDNSGLEFNAFDIRFELGGQI